jgi:hypothetical protein
MRDKILYDWDHCLIINSENSIVVDAKKKNKFMCGW